MAGDAANPFVDPQAYRAYVERKEASFRAELERQRVEGVGAATAHRQLLAQNAPAPQAGQELLLGEDLDALDEVGGALVADEDGVARAVVGDEGAERTEIRWVDSRGSLHFHRGLTVSEHEIDLEAALRPPEVDPVAELPVGPGSPENAASRAPLPGGARGAGPGAWQAPA